MRDDLQKIKAKSPVDHYPPPSWHQYLIGPYSIIFFLQTQTLDLRVCTVNSLEALKLNFAFHTCYFYFFQLCIIYGSVQIKIECIKDNLVECFIEVHNLLIFENGGWLKHFKEMKRFIIHIITYKIFSIASIITYKISTITNIIT